MAEPKMKIEVDDKSLVRALGTLNRKADIVIARAANRTIATTNKAMSRGVRERYPKVKDGDVKKALFKRRATPERPLAELTYKSSHENLYKHGYISPRRIVRGNDPKYYKARVMRGHPYVPLTERPRPFVQRIKNKTGEDKVGLFRRMTEEEKKGYNGSHKRNAITAVYAAAVSQMMKNDEVLQDAEKAAGDMFLKRLEHEIDREIKR